LGPVGHISYLSKHSFELQIADMMAYEAFKYLDNRVALPEKAMRRSFEKIIKGNPLAFYLLDETVLDYDLPNVRKFLADYLFPPK